MAGVSDPDVPWLHLDGGELDGGVGLMTVDGSWVHVSFRGEAEADRILGMTTEELWAEAERRGLVRRARLHERILGRVRRWWRWRNA